HFHVTLLNLQGLTFSKRTLKNRRSSLPLSLFFSLPSFIKIRNPGYALPFYICLFTFALTLRNLEGLPIPKTNRSEWCYSQLLALASFEANFRLKNLLLFLS